MKKILSTVVVYLLPLALYAQSLRIRGTVKDKEEALPGIIVSLEHESFNTVTDLDGNFELTGIPKGTHTLRIASLGYETLLQQVVVDQDLSLGVITLNTQSLKEVQVVAELKGTETKALNMMKASNVFANIVSAEGVAKLPDRNVAEAVQRLPGVVMESDQGEGRFISFRGTPSDWSSALVNGDRMPVADEESKTRAMNFDIFPSSLVDYIVVSKTLSPDMEGDAIGGSANFMTKSAPATKTLQASLGAGYNAQAAKPVYNASLAYGNSSRNGRFGYFAGGSLYSRNWATDNYQVFYGSNRDQSLTRLELRDYEGKRTTLGFNGALEYKFNDDAKIYAKGVYGSMNDNEFNRKTMYNWSTGWGQSIKLQNIHNIMQTRFWGAELGGDFKAGRNLSANWRVASYRNSFAYGAVPYSKGDARNGYHVVEFEKAVDFTDFLYLDEQGRVTDEMNAYDRLKLLDIDSPVPGYGDNYKNIQPQYRNTHLVNPTDSLFAFTRAYSETNQTIEKDPIVAQLDLQYHINNNLKIKFGGKLRMKEGERKVGLELWERNKDLSPAIIYNNYNPAPFNERGGFLKELGSPYAGKLFPFFDVKGTDNFVRNLGDSLRYIPFGVKTPYFQQMVGSSYSYTENVYAGYAMAEWQPVPGLTIVPGLRAEYTAPEVKADSIMTVDPALGTVALTNVRAGKAYLSLLPMLNVKYALTERQNLRFAATRSFRRPNFNEIKPGAAAIDYSNNDLLYGNPDLKPTYSWNFDLAYERYLGATSMFSASVFYKNVKDHIYTAFEASSTDNTGISNEFQIPGGVIAKKFQNAPQAMAAGFEAALMTKLRFLPGIMKNLGVSINYSHTYSRMNIDARDKPQQLPRQSPNVMNVALFFENGKITTRLGLNYRDPYLYELNLYAVKDPASQQTLILHQDNDYDVYIGRSMTLDYSFSYRFKERFSFFVELNNLTNTPYTMYRGRKERPLKTEYYSIRGLAGIRFNL
ncbi:TonB-dependent receptor [Taibaiella chishuiensis]|uniref:TonB-dependent receptor n=1 Tax=Taibaiella chishuiensis TaxID=1434707 RepID=A0A2P8DDH2_9BACT|nr:TonB-dependent receptor [Taibaiella chishuiensis]PSK95281.1 TonB-dependent receptor [Taibaiella chishuiensis]